MVVPFVLTRLLSVALAAVEVEVALVVAVVVAAMALLVVEVEDTVVEDMVRSIRSPLQIYALCLQEQVVEEETTLTAGRVEVRVIFFDISSMMKTLLTTS